MLGVIDARNPAQLDLALQQLAGGLSTPIVATRDRLLNVVAQLEANLDFTEEPDVDPLERAALVNEIRDFAAELAMLDRQLTDRDRPDAVPRVVLVGPPNVGKSRLFNALVGKERAIVSPEPGTTRDYLTGSCDCDGLTVLLVDTAGIEATPDSITTQAQHFRSRQTETADLLLECRTAGILDARLEDRDRRRPRLCVWTKCDRTLPDGDDWGEQRAIVTSAATGEGLRELKLAIAGTLRRTRSRR